MSYCTICGKALVRGKFLFYSPQTGQPLHDEECPNKCGERAERFAAIFVFGMVVVVLAALALLFWAIA